RGARGEIRSCAAEEDHGRRRAVRRAPPERQADRGRRRFHQPHGARRFPQDERDPARLSRDHAAPHRLHRQGEAVRSRLSAEDRMRRVTEAWFITEPLLFPAWITHRLVPRAGAGTLRSGDGRIDYDPAFIQALPDRTLEELLRLEAVRI